MATPLPPKRQSVDSAPESGCKDRTGQGCPLDSIQTATAAFALPVEIPAAKVRENANQ
jgi:hypothetical protein